MLRKKLGRYTNCKHCIAIDLILKHNQKVTMLGRVRYIFQLFINVNKGVFGITISYLRIKSYNVLNFNNCSAD